MATKTMYRLLNLQTGTIDVYDWQLSGHVTLNEIKIEYDDQLDDSCRQLILDGIEKRKGEIAAEMIILEQRKQELLCIEHKPQQPEWEPFDGN